MTSPPYWGLRDYGLPPSLWGGEASCEHDFGPVGKMHRGGANGGGAATIGRDQSARDAVKDFFTGQTCVRCGGWLGCLGLEPTPQMYVEHLVEVFRAVRRVLRADGTVWLNLGDSYATGAGKVGDAPGGGEQGRRWRGEVTRHRDEKRREHGQPRMNGHGNPQIARGRGIHAAESSGKHGPRVASMGPMTQPNRMPIPGLKPKDLVMVPARSALALQADGWWVRQDIIWSKPNPMPESVRDRCTKSHEYLFLLAKSERYYFDAEAIAEPRVGSDDSGVSGWAHGDGSHTTIEHNRQKGDAKTFRGGQYVNGNKFKNSHATVRSSTGNQHSEKKTRNRRSVWTITPSPFAEAHFATFPPALIEPCILAGAPRGGVVLDPFGGAGTTGLVADRHGRDAVLIELNPEYASMSERRIRGDAPLFAEVTASE